MDPDRAAPASSPIPADFLATFAPPSVQNAAARMAQDAFSQVFRLTLTAAGDQRSRDVASLTSALQSWVACADRDEARSLRLAMLMTGLDQWGLAYSRAFALQAIPGLTELVGALRTSLDPQADARFQQKFSAIDEREGNVIDFKIALRRGIHLALWHAMIASDDRDQAVDILSHLAGMMSALARAMPELGWRLIADALAHIQIQCLSEGFAAQGLAREMTEALFAALSQELPAERRDLAMAHASRAVLAWQQARRPPSGFIH